VVFISFKNQSVKILAKNTKMRKIERSMHMFYNLAKVSILEMFQKEELKK